MFREHFARQTNLAANLKDVFDRAMYGSDPETAYLIGGSLVKDQKMVLPLAIRCLLLYPENFEFEAEVAEIIEPKEALGELDTEPMEVDDSELTVNDFLMDVDDHDYC